MHRHDGLGHKILFRGCVCCFSAAVVVSVGVSVVVADVVAIVIDGKHRRFV